MFSSAPFVVYKFGGTSLGTPERMQNVANIVQADSRRKIVVLSAVSGTTNELLQLFEEINQGATEAAQGLIKKLRSKYYEYIDEIVPQSSESNHQLIDKHFSSLQETVKKTPSPELSCEIVSKGELLSTAIFAYFLRARNIDNAYLSALEFMRTDKTDEPDEYFIQSMLEKELSYYPEQNLFITQGYICRNSSGVVHNLKRGGSDYSATLIGQAVGAQEIQIWTDIDGLHNNDPRIVNDTHPIPRLSYNEASELAYFGAKILHPSCVRPAQKRGIPIHLKNTMDPSAMGTIVSDAQSGKTITAVAAKDGITAIKIVSGRMLNAYGFLKRIFEVFERYKTPIDMVTTSEVGVSVTIDNTSHLDEIREELVQFGEVQVDTNQSIVCIVGDFQSNQVGYAAKIFDSLGEVPIRMISYGGSQYNVSILVRTDDKASALLALNRGLF